MVFWFFINMIETNWILISRDYKDLKCNQHRYTVLKNNLGWFKTCLKDVKSKKARAFLEAETASPRVKGRTLIASIDMRISKY